MVWIGRTQISEACSVKDISIGMRQAQGGKETHPAEVIRSIGWLQFSSPRLPKR